MNKNNERNLEKHEGLYYVVEWWNEVISSGETRMNFKRIKLIIYALGIVSILGSALFFSQAYASHVPKQSDLCVSYWKYSSKAMEECYENSKKKGNQQTLETLSPSYASFLIGIRPIVPIAPIPIIHS